MLSHSRNNEIFTIFTIRQDFSIQIPFFSSIVKPKELGNNLAPNDRLNNAEILFSGQVKGAEAFDSWNGELYTSAHGGYVLRLTEKELVPIVKFGQDCRKLSQIKFRN